MISLHFTGCFYSTTVGELRSYENPKNKVTAVPATEEEIWGAKFMVTLFLKPQLLSRNRLILQCVCVYYMILRKKIDKLIGIGLFSKNKLLCLHHKKTDMLC